MYKRKGFSMVELMIGIFILSALIVLVSGLYTRLFKMSSKGVDLTAGTAVGEKVMEEFIQRYMPKSQGGVDVTFPNGETGNKAINTSRYYYKIDVKDAAANLKMITVTVTWWQTSTGATTPAPTSTPESTGTMNLDDVEAYVPDKTPNTKIQYEHGITNYGTAFIKLTKLVYVPNSTSTSSTVNEP